MIRAATIRLLAILACCAALSLAPRVARAEVDHDGTFWTGYMSSWWLNPQWGLWFDTHWNLDTFFVLRGGLSYAFEKGPVVTGGYAWLLLNPDLERQEHRAWGQVFMPYRFNEKWSISGRLRMDFRWLEGVENGEIVGGFPDFIWRTRLQSSLTRRFPKMRFGVPFVQGAHEILVNPYASDGRSAFDQNRFSAMFGLETKIGTFRVGYMNRYIESSTRHEHAGIIWLTQRIDLGRWTRHFRQPDVENFPEFGGP